MKKVNVFIALSFLAAGIMFTACKKDSSKDGVTDTQIADAQDQSIASTAYDDVDAEVDDALGSSLKAMEADTTPSNKLTRKKGGFVRELNFDNITRNGKVKSGKIIVTVTYPTTGDTTDEKKWVRTVTFDNYTVGQRKIEGTKTIEYLGKVDGTHPQWKITLTGGKVTFKNGKTITCDYVKTRVMTEGYDTPLVRADNKFEFNGSGSGTNRKGVSYTITYDKVVKAALCPHFKSGTITYVCDTKTTVITYNAGTSCEQSATITVNGETKTIDGDAEAN